MESVHFEHHRHDWTHNACQKTSSEQLRGPKLGVAPVSIKGQWRGDRNNKHKKRTNYRKGLDLRPCTRSLRSPQIHKRPPPKSKRQGELRTLGWRRSSSFEKNHKVSRVNSDQADWDVRRCWTSSGRLSTSAAPQRSDLSSGPLFTPIPRLNHILRSRYALQHDDPAIPETIFSLAFSTFDSDSPWHAPFHHLLSHPKALLPPTLL